MRNGRVSRTALGVAATMVTLGAKPGWRARLPAGLPELSEALLLVAGEYPFTDRALVLSRQRWAVGLASLGEKFQPGSFEGLGRRKIYMDSQVRTALNEGAEQVLVLGAGFDTLCLRLAAEYPEQHFVELDHPDTGRVKAAALRSLGQPDNMTLLAADLARRPLAQVLAGHSPWNADAVSVVVAEGLLYYLPRRAVTGLFAQLATCTGHHSRVAFSHLFDPRSYRLARAALALGGEPWLSSSSTIALPAYIGPGWDIVDAVPGKRYRDLESFALAQRAPY